MPGNFENTQGKAYHPHSEYVTKMELFGNALQKLRFLKATVLHFSVDGQQFVNETFRKRWRHMISVTESSTNINPK